MKTHAAGLKKIALVGNPNSGKTSLFNALTHLRQKVGNYPGVTVDIKKGTAEIASRRIEIIDLPGTYSIYPKSDDERIVSEVLLDSTHPSHPDAVVVVIDATNLKRNLLFCSQIIDIGLPTIAVLTMADMLEKRGIRIDPAKLSEQLGIPVLLVNARRQKGIEKLKHYLKKGFDRPKKEIYSDIPLPSTLLKAGRRLYPDASNYFIWLEILRAQESRKSQDSKMKVLRELLRVEQVNIALIQGKETLGRYKKIEEIIMESVDDSLHKSVQISERLDDVFTHRVWGPLILLAILFLVFQAVFFLADFPMRWVEDGTAWISTIFSNYLPTGWFKSLLVEGVIAGLGGIVVFIPQIAILFGFLSILEDTGYMARISYITDRIMRGVGLSGKSVIPLISGMACAIPAIMATRSIENWRNRLVTILITPFMTCSARLPVYTLLISIGIPSKTLLGFINLQGLVLLAMYLLGIGMSMAIAYILRFFIPADGKSLFVMEMPLYRAPRWRNVFITMYERSKVFVTEAGKVILIISIVLWFLASFGPADLGMHHEEFNTEQMTNAQYKSYKLKHSFAGYLGKAIEPVIRPIGFDWRMGIAVITSFAAREVFAGTMATIYSVEGDGDEFHSVREAMLHDVDAHGRKVYSLATVLSLLVFYAFAMQCMSTLAVVKRETKSWKWPAIQFAYMTVIAYSASFIVYQLFR